MSRTITEEDLRNILNEVLPPKDDETEVINLTTSSLTHLARVDNPKVYRKGKVGVLSFNLYNTSVDLVKGGSASFNISGLPTLVAPTKIVGYSGNTPIICSVTQTTVTARITGTDWVKNYNCVCEGVVLFE